MVVKRARCARSGTAADALILIALPFSSRLSRYTAWRIAARAQHPRFAGGRLYRPSNGADASAIAAFRKGLSETAYVEGQNVSVEYHWLDVTTHRRFAGPNCLFRI
jgi:hypothetical protein